MIWAHRKQEGFALPTILIAGVVMLIVLVSAVTATESVSSALDRQYYDQLAREAAESGIAFAQYCLESNGYTPSWTSSYPLRPDKDCTGASSSGASEWIVNQGNIQTTFSVPAPTNQNVSQVVVATGTVQLLRPSSGQPWRTYTYSSSAQIGVNLNLNTVAFGYVGGGGSYFGAVTADGTLHMVGYNGWGQLSNGTITDTLTPTKYILNGTDKPASVYTNFLSGGIDTFVITNNGTVYGAGYNANGQLGDGTTANRSQAVQFYLPAGVTGKSVAIVGSDTFVLGSDNNIYTVGMCANGLLGYNYTISGCTDQSLYKRANLPTPTSDPNTVPTTNITTDNHSVYVRMQGGKVYGWGGNSRGQLANNSTTDSSDPVQIGSFGNSGQPQATQVFTDGSSVWIVDSTGKVWGAGENKYGQLGGQNISIYNPHAGHCLDNKSGDGVTLQLYSCNGTRPQQYTFQSDGSIYNAKTNRCIDNTSHSSSNGTGISLAICDGTSAEKFQMHADGTISNPAYNVCIDNKNGDGTNLQLYACLSNANQTFSLPDQSHLVQYNLPDQAGAAVKVASDQYSVVVLTSNGQVWGAGYNQYGQLGDGKNWTHQPFPVQFILPSGVTAIDLWNTAYSPTSGLYNNTFVIGSDGKVYGTGSNGFGQLGNGTTTNTLTPVAMSIIDGSTIKALQVESGYGTTIVLTDNHKVYTVGNNSNGQLGNGTTTNSSTPQANKYTNVLLTTIF